jgi:hypothetical protein
MPIPDLQDIEYKANRLEDSAVSDLFTSLIQYISILEDRIIELETTNRNP